MAKRRPPGEPPPEQPFGQEWARDREPSKEKLAFKSLPSLPAPSWAILICRFAWRRIFRPFLKWGGNLIKRAFDELLVFSLKALALTSFVLTLGGGIVALKNYSLREIVDTIVVTVSKQHGIETGSIGMEPSKPPTVETPQVSPPVTHEPPEKLEPRPAVSKRRPQPAKQKPFIDRLIDRIDEALGWKTPTS